MKVFVAGATGYTGREVVRELRLRGIDVVAHVRPDSSRLAEWRARFASLGATVDTSFWDLTSFQLTMERERPSHVFSLLGTTRARSKRAAGHGAKESYESVDYGLTSIALRATRNARFIYLSSMGVSAAARNSYLAVRWRMETEIKASGLPYIIARPAFITGSDREEFRPAEKVGAAVANAALHFAGFVGLRSLHERFASMTGPELARALSNAALDEHCANVTLEADQLRAWAGH